MEKVGILKLVKFIYQRFSKEKHFKKYFFLSLTFNTLNQIFPIIWSYFLALLLDSIIQNINNSLDSKVLISKFIIFFCINILYIIVSQTNEYINSKWTSWQNYWEDNVYVGKKSTIEPQMFENSEFMNDYNTMEWNDWRILDTLQDSGEVLAQLFAVVTSFIALTSYSPLLSLFAVLSAIPSAIVVKIFGQKIWNIWNSKGEDKIKFSSYRWPFNTTEPAQIQEMFVYKYGRYLLNKMREINETFIGRLNKNTDKRYYWSLAASLSSMIFFILAIGYSVNLALAGAISIGLFTFVISAYQQFQSNISVMFYKISSILGNKKLLSIFYDVQNHENTVPDGTEKVTNANEGLKITFDHVWFKYPNTENWVLRDINFEISPDEDLAIVGQNGAGKSTLIKVLLRIYDVNKGRVLINDKDIKDLNQEDYYKYIGFLSQLFNKFSISVEENIYMGDMHNENEEAMKKAAKMADIDGAVQKLPNGYKTFLNREVRGGVDLSGGQWQKLAIARAFFRNPKLLILDEPTSAVDALSEEKIFDNIRKNAQGRTTLIVSHRFATVKKAKRIIVIDNGSIVEDGNHDELMKLGGLYSTMYKTQVESN